MRRRDRHCRNLLSIARGLKPSARSDAPATRITGR